MSWNDWSFKTLSCNLREALAPLVSHYFSFSHFLPLVLARLPFIELSCCFTWILLAKLLFKLCHIFSYRTEYELLFSTYFSGSDGIHILFKSIKDEGKNLEFLKLLLAFFKNLVSKLGNLISFIFLWVNILHNQNCHGFWIR